MAVVFVDEEIEQPKTGRVVFVDDEPTGSPIETISDAVLKANVPPIPSSTAFTTVPGMSSVTDPLKAAIPNVAPRIETAYTKFLDEFKAAIPQIRSEIKTSLDKQVFQGAGEFTENIAQAGGYMGAGAVKGASLGYVDPTRTLEKIPFFQDAPISKGIAGGTGQLIGAALPIGAGFRAAGEGIKAINLVNQVRPWMQTLAESVAVGGAYGGLRKPEEGETRGRNALNDAAMFGAMTGAGLGVARAISKNILIPESSMPEVLKKSEDALMDTYLKGSSRKEAQRVFYETMTKEAEAARKSVMAGTPGTTNLEPLGAKISSVSVDVPTEFSNAVGRLVERIKKPSVQGKPFFETDVAIEPKPTVPAERGAMGEAQTIQTRPIEMPKAAPAAIPTQAQVSVTPIVQQPIAPVQPAPPIAPVAPPTAAASVPVEPQAISPAQEVVAEDTIKPAVKATRKTFKTIKTIQAMNEVITKRKNVHPTLQSIAVEDGIAKATDMEVSIELKTDLPSGIYKTFGQNIEPSQARMEDFPKSPEIGKKIGTVNRDDFIYNFERALKASSDDDTRYILNSVNLKTENGKSYLYATDGRRLSMNALDTANLPDGSYVIPNLKKITKALTALEGGTLDVGLVGDNAIEFKGTNGRVVSRLLDGKFPKLEDVLPEPKEQISISKRDLDGALETMKPYVKEISKAKDQPTISFEISGDNPASIKMTIASDKAKISKTVELKGVVARGNYEKISTGSIVMPMQTESATAVNFNYLKDAVDSINSDTVYIGKTEDNKHPLAIRGTPMESKIVQKGKQKVSRKTSLKAPGSQQSKISETDQPSLPRSSLPQSQQQNPPIQPETSPPDVVPEHTYFQAPKDSSISTVTREQDFVNLTNDAIAVIEKYKDMLSGARGETPSLRAQDHLHGIMHKMSAAMRSKNMDEVKRLEAKYPDLQNEFQAVYQKNSVHEYPKARWYDKFISGQWPESIRPKVGIERQKGQAQPDVLESQTGEASSSSTKIESFEPPTDAEKDPKAFKMFERVRAMVKKYTATLGEGYVRRGAEGTYRPGWDSVRVKAVNNLSHAVHETAHAIDMKLAKTTSKIMDRKSKTNTADIIRDLSEIYAEHYPNGSYGHPVVKRVTEGLATFVQKLAQRPTEFKEKYPSLFHSIFIPGGRLYDKRYVDLLKEARQIVADFGSLSKLDQGAAFITADFQKNQARGSYLNFRDKIRSEIADAIWPTEKAGKLAGVSRTFNDPSLWQRQFQSITGMVMENIFGKRGVYVPTKQGGFKKVSDFVHKDILKEAQATGPIERADAWLVARDQHFKWKDLDRQKAEILALVERGKAYPKEKAEIVKILKPLIEKYQHGRGVLRRNPQSRKEYDAQYEEGKTVYAKLAEMVDAFTGAGIDLAEMSDLRTPEQIAAYRAGKGYAPMKRDFYDDVLGEDVKPTSSMTGAKSMPSSFRQRTGGEQTIISPLYQIAKDHAELYRKAMRQMVYNKLNNIAESLNKAVPGLIERLQLKAVPDGKGNVIFPQDRDPNIIMARDNEGTRVPLLVGKDLKKFMDDNMSFTEFNNVQKIMTYWARTTSRGITGLYLPFVMITNPIMDMTTAAMNTRTQMKPVFSAVNELGKALLKRDGEEFQYAREWFASHGERHSMMGWQSDTPQELMDKVFNENKGIMRFIRAIDNAIDILSIPGKYSELINRMTEYIRSRKAGNPWVVAMEDSARVTTPFSHFGRWGGGNFVKTLVKSVSFFNPKIQGLDQFMRSAKDKQTRKQVAFVLATVVAASVAGLAGIAASEKEEKLEQFKQLTPKELSAYVWLPNMLGKGLLKIRILEEAGWLAATLNMAIMEALGEVDYTPKEFKEAVLSPIPDQFDLTHPIIAAMNWIPTMIRPEVETIFNTKTWPAPRPLVNSSLIRREPRFQYHETTSGMAKYWGDKLNVSPIVIDNLIEGHGGRVMQFLTGRAYTREKLNPLFHKWYMTSGRNIDDYYKTKKATEQMYETYKKERRQLSDDEKNKLSDNLPLIKSIEKNLDVLRDMSSQELDDKDEEMYQIYKVINENISQLKDY